MDALSGSMEVSKHARKQSGPSDIRSTKFRTQHPSGGVLQ